MRRDAAEFRRLARRWQHHCRRRNRQRPAARQVTGGNSASRQHGRCGWATLQTTAPPLQVATLSPTARLPAGGKGEASSTPGPAGGSAAGATTLFAGGSSAGPAAQLLPQVAPPRTPAAQLLRQVNKRSGTVPQAEGTPHPEVLRGAGAARAGSAWRQRRGRRGSVATGGSAGGPLARARLVREEPLVREGPRPQRPESRRDIPRPHTKCREGRSGRRRQCAGWPAHGERVY